MCKVISKDNWIEYRMKINEHSDKKLIKKGTYTLTFSYEMCYSSGYVKRLYPSNILQTYLSNIP